MEQEHYICKSCLQSIPKMNEIVHNIRCIRKLKNNEIDDKIVNQSTINEESISNEIIVNDTINRTKDNEINISLNEYVSTSDFNQINQWPCRVCTFLNNMNSNICEACESARLDETILCQQTDETWECRACTCRNDNSNSNCIVCDTKRFQNNADDNTWICSYCSYINNLNSNKCELCDNINNSNNIVDDFVRPPDEIYSERLIDTPYDTPIYSQSDTISQHDNSNLAVSMVVGGMLGGALAFMSNNRVSVTDGAIAGASIGVLSNIISNSPVVETYHSNIRSNHIREFLEEQFNSVNHDVSSGLSETVISNLPTGIIEQTMLNDTSSDSMICGICLDNFQTGQTFRILPCLHKFHRQCIDRWLKVSKTCPICKNNVN